MINQLLFASNNKGKISEINSLVSKPIQIITLAEAGITEELPEPYFTFKENAWSKAQYAFHKAGIPCFAEDSGLVVPALQGAPGVFSARYAGPSANDEANNTKLINELKEITDRSAYYQAVICFINSEGTYYFEGRCPGTIALNPAGTGGFGYDPLFIPEGSQRTFAEFSPEEKNKISHRAKALQQLTGFLNHHLHHDVR